MSGGNGATPDPLLKLDSVDVTVTAIDSEPAEPFPARNGALVLAPGGRLDAFVDVKAAPGSNLNMLLPDAFTKPTRPNTNTGHLFFHQGRCNTLFADGHAKALLLDDPTTFRWTVDDAKLTGDQRRVIRDVIQYGEQQTVNEGR